MTSDVNINDKLVEIFNSPAAGRDGVTLREIRPGSQDAAQARVDYLVMLGLVTADPDRPGTYTRVPGETRNVWAALRGFATPSIGPYSGVNVTCAGCGETGDSDEVSYYIFDTETKARSYLLEDNDGYGWAEVDVPGAGKRLLCSHCKRRSACAQEGHREKITEGFFDPDTGRVYPAYTSCDRCDKLLTTRGEVKKPPGNYPTADPHVHCIRWDGGALPGFDEVARALSRTVELASAVRRTRMFEEYQREHPEAPVPDIALRTENAAASFQLAFDWLNGFLDGLKSADQDGGPDPA